MGELGDIRVQNRKSVKKKCHFRKPEENHIRAHSTLALVPETSKMIKSIPKGSKCRDSFKKE